MLDTPKQEEVQTRIEVTFGVDIDLTDLNTAKAALEKLRPATVEYSVAWDHLKAKHAHFLGRLEGECMAYMNIAKAKAKELYGL